MKYDMLKNIVFDEIENNLNELTALSDDLFDHPEVSGKEYRSSEKIVKLLRNYGYDVEYPFAGLDTAFRAVYGKNNHKYKVALLTEYDALPEIGHACGHCVSGSISVLAGLAVKGLAEELDTDVHIIGTPNEEEDGAKCAMIEQGVFDNYDMAIMVHLYNSNLPSPKLQGLASYMSFMGKQLMLLQLRGKETMRSMQRS